MPEYMLANSGRSLASRTAGLAGSALPTILRSVGCMLLVLLLGIPTVQLRLRAAGRGRKRAEMPLISPDANPHRPLRSRWYADRLRSTDPGQLSSHAGAARTSCANRLRVAEGCGHSVDGTARRVAGR